MGAKKKTKAAKPKAKKVVVIPRRIIKQVDEGVKFLDILFGREEWLSRMDMTLFDIEDPSTCVAGNVFANGMTGYENFTDAMRLLHVEDMSGIKFGFNEDVNGDFPHLQDVWVRIIKRMKKEAKII